MKVADTVVQVQIVPFLDLGPLEAQIAALKASVGHVDELETEHFDRMSLPPLAPPEQQADGSWVFEGRVARVHSQANPLRYLNKKTGDWDAQHRDADELARIVGQLAGTKVVAPPDKPVHHPEMLTDAKGQPTDAPHRVVGEILSARLDGEFAIAKIRITDEETLTAIRDGVRELSLGYWSKHDSARYQRNTRIDHLAVVPFARCGETCELRADAADVAHSDGECGCQEHVQATFQGCACQSANAVPQIPVSGTGQHEDMKMDELQKKLEAAQAEAAALKAKLDAAEQRATQAEKDRDSARVSASDAKKDLDSEKARADAAEKDVEDAKLEAQKDAEEQLTARVDARVELLAAAQPIVGKTVKVGDQDVPLAKLDDRAIKVAVVKHVDGEDIAAGETLDFVNGMYRGALKRAGRATESRSTVRQTIEQARQDAADKKPARLQARVDEDAAKAAMNKDTSTRWSKQGR